MANYAKSRSAAAPSKRDRVVDAASKLFLDKGYGATGMDAIAQEAGVSKATVYSYYSDKSSLYADVMARTCDEMGGHIQLEGLISGSPEETLTAVALQGVRRMLEAIRRQILPRIVAESREFPELGKKFWEAGPGKIRGLVARYLEDAKTRGILDVDDPPRAADRLVGQIQGIYLLPMLTGIRNRPSEDEIRRDVEEVVADFVRPRRRAS